jgi:hypothetical protein
MYNDETLTERPYVSNPVKHYVDDTWYWESTAKAVERI